MLFIHFSVKNGPSSEPQIRWVFFFQPKSIDISIFLHENICCGYSLEAPQWGASNEYPQYVFCWEIRKQFIRIHLLSGAMHYNDTSKRYFWWVPTTCFCGEIRKLFTWYSLLSRAVQLLVMWSILKCASTRQNLQWDLCDQLGLRPACTSTQYGKGSRSSLYG